MTPIGKSSDASFYYQEDATADIARMDSSAVYGNLADAMKNATIVFTTPQVIERTVASQTYETDGYAKQNGKPYSTS
jgi:hypothetical protein